MYDFVDQKWHFVEENNEAPFTRAVLFGGETLSKLTNDYFTSCLHKVVRVNIFFFFQPIFVALKIPVLESSFFPFFFFSEN